ncbi:MAG: hypothetical protein IJZ73_04160 [Clostridia bacterium]|nr:hypothetical protein [Clostridia bacterium]
MIKHAKTLSIITIIFSILFELIFLSYLVNAKSTEKIVASALNQAVVQDLDGNYARVIDDKTPFYSDEDGVNALFYLPYTYYVKVLNNSGLLTHVEYGFDTDTLFDGYVPTDKLFFDDLSVDTPFPTVTLSAEKTVTLFDDKNCTKNLQYVFSGRKMKFLGHVENNGIYLCYVEYNGTTGYVKEEDLAPYSIPNHKNPLTFLPQEDDKNLNLSINGNNDNLVLKILIIACLLGAGIVALFTAFRKKPSSSIAVSGYYDENDFE